MQVHLLIKERNELIMTSWLKICGLHGCIEKTLLSRYDGIIMDCFRSKGMVNDKTVSRLSYRLIDVVERTAALIMFCMDYTNP